MAKVLQAGYTSYGAYINADIYSVGVGGELSYPATEVQAQTRFAHAGTLSRLGVNSGAGAGGTTVFKLRKNGSDGNLTVTLTTGTGWFYDTTHTDTIAAGDLVCFYNTAYDIYNAYAVTTVFEATTDHKSLIVGDEYNTGATASETTYYGDLAPDGWLYTTISGHQNSFYAPGTLSGFAVSVTSNARTTSTVCSINKNGSVGNNTVTVGAGATGQFADTTHTDSIASGDLVCYQVVNGTGTESIRYDNVCVGFQSASTLNDLFGAGTSRTASATTHYFGLWGGVTSTSWRTVEADAAWSHGFASKLRKARFNITANTYTGAATIRSRIAGANGSIIVSVPSATTGWFADYSNIDTFAADDLCCFSIFGGTANSLTLGPYRVTEGTKPSGKVMHVLSLWSPSATARTSGTTYQPIGGRMLASGAEAESRTRIARAGTWSNLAARLTSAGTSRDIDFRLGGLSQTQTVTPSNGLSGTFEDTTHSDAQASTNGDVNDRFVTTGDAGVFWERNVFQATDCTAASYASTGEQSFTSASTTKYLYLADLETYIASGPTNVYSTCRAPGTLDYFGIYISANARTTDTVFSTHINGATGNLTVTVGSGGTGAYVDSAHTDELEDGDLFCWKGVTGTGTGTLSLKNIFATFESHDRRVDRFVFAMSNGRNGNADSFVPVGGGHEWFTDIGTNNTDSQIARAFPALTTNFRSHVGSNDHTTPVLIRPFKNGAAANEYVTVGAGTTGWFEDTTRWDWFSATDTINYAMTGGDAGGFLYPDMWAITEQEMSTTPFAPAFLLPSLMVA